MMTEHLKLPSLTQSSNQLLANAPKKSKIVTYLRTTVIKIKEFLKKKDMILSHSNKNGIRILFKASQV